MRGRMEAMGRVGSHGSDVENREAEDTLPSVRFHAGWGWLSWNFKQVFWRNLSTGVKGGWWGAGPGTGVAKRA